MEYIRRRHKRPLNPDNNNKNFLFFYVSVQHDCLTVRYIINIIVRNLNLATNSTYIKEFPRVQCRINHGCQNYICVLFKMYYRVASLCMCIDSCAIWRFVNTRLSRRLSYIHINVFRKSTPWMDRRYAYTACVIKVYLVYRVCQSVFLFYRNHVVDLLCESFY